MSRVVTALIGRQAAMQATLEALAHGRERERAPTSASGDHELLERACACGASLRTLVPARSLAAVVDAWDVGHRRPACRPVSTIAAWELRHERAAAWWLR